MLYILMSHDDENDHWLIETDLPKLQIEPVIRTAIQEFLDRADGKAWYDENGEFAWYSLGDLPKDLMTKHGFRIIETADDLEVDPDLFLEPSGAAV